MDIEKASAHAPSASSESPVRGNDIATANAIDESDRRLRELGYKPEFRREMNVYGVVGMSFTAIGILTGMSSAFQTGLFAGGPLGLFWGWNICSLFMFLIALCLAEICSALPTMGGLYYWVSKMKHDKPAFGYVTGVLYSFAMVFTGTSGNLSTALFIASMAEVGQGITLSRSAVAGIAFGINILSGVINSFGSRGVGAIAQINIWWTLIGTIILVVTLLVKAPHKNTADFVFTDFENFTGWGNRGFVVLLGFLQAVYTLEGCETSAQVAEEAKRAEWLAPIGIAVSIVGSWFIGLVYMLALLFSVQDIASVQQTAFAIPIAQLYYDAVGKHLTILCLFIIASAQFWAAITAFTASSRLFYSLARDNALPAKSTFMRLNRYQAPYVGVWFSVLVGIVISCAYIGSAVAFNAILSSAAVAVMLSYGMPILCRVLWPDSLGERGPFHLGKYSWSINFASAAFTLFVCILFILPTSTPVTAINMNYAIVAIGGVLLLILISWFAYGMRHYKGPVSTVDMKPEVDHSLDKKES